MGRYKTSPIIYTIEDVDYLHIQQFVDLIERTQQSTRHLIEDGNSIRRMKARRDRSRLLIPVIELLGYPFVNSGKQLNGRDIYHYVPYNKDGTVFKGDVRTAFAEGVIWKRELCEACTYTLDKCLNRSLADSLEVPAGDA